MTATLFGPYQAGGIFVMRTWATKNASALERYLAAYIEGCRAAQNPAQRELTLQVLMRELKVDRRIAELTYNELNLAGSGLFKDCGWDMQAFRNVLALRAEIEGQWGGKPPVCIGAFHNCATENERENIVPPPSTVKPNFNPTQPKGA